MNKGSAGPSHGPQDESQLVTFLLKDEEFGFDITSVREIIRLPKVAKVPRTPDYVDGIANLRGTVLPIIDMRTRFGMERSEVTDCTRVLVVEIDGVKAGLRVDRVKQVTRVSRAEIEALPDGIRGTSSGYFEGIVKLNNGQRIVMTLNAARLCEIAIRHKPAPAAEIPSGPEAANSVSTAKPRDAGVQFQKIVSFQIGNEEFAFPMEHIREILRVRTPNRVPDVPEYVLGVLTVRNRILPVIDLRRLLQQRSLADESIDHFRSMRDEYERWIANAEKTIAASLRVKVDDSVAEQLRKRLVGTKSSRFEEQIAQNIQEEQRIIVVDVEGFVLGLVVDHVREVLNVSKSLIEAPPRITSRGAVGLSGVARLNDGSRLIMLPDVAALMKDQKLRDVQGASIQAVEKESVENVYKTTAGGPEQGGVQLVTFLLGAEEYGIPISQIQEIDRLARITQVPKAAEFIEGVTNLRGEVIPVMSMRKRFDLDVKAPDDRTRIIIVDIGGVKTGLVVDSVREVLHLRKRDITSSPGAIGAGLNQPFISGIGKVDDGRRIIVLLDLEKVLSRQEQVPVSGVVAPIKGETSTPGG